MIISKKRIVASAMAMAIMAGTFGAVSEQAIVGSAATINKSVTYSINNSYNPGGNNYSLYSYNGALSADGSYIPSVIQWNASTKKPVYYTTGSTAGKGVTWKVTNWEKSGWNVTLTTTPTSKADKKYYKAGSANFQLGIAGNVDVGVGQHKGSAKTVTLFVNDHYNKYKTGKEKSTQYTMTKNSAMSSHAGLNVYSAKVKLNLKDPTGKYKKYTKTMYFLENSKKGKTIKTTGSITAKVLTGTSKINFANRGTVDKKIGGYNRTFYLA